MVQKKRSTKVRDLKNILKLAILKYSPTLIIICFLILLTEVFKYSGFFAKHFFIDAKIFLLLTLHVVFWIKNIYKKKIPFLDSFLSKFSAYLATAFLMFYIFLVAMENVYYNNYVFSNFHIYIPSTLYIFFYFFGLSVIYAIYDRDIGKSFSRFLKRKNCVYILLVFFIFSYSCIREFSKSLDRSINSLGFIVLHLDYDYNQKMDFRYPYFYRYMKLLTQSIPEDSKIGIPPKEAPWIMTGNAPLVRYFLYPREIVNLDRNLNNVFEVDYVLIAKGLSQTQGISSYGWPKEKLENVELYYLDSENLKWVSDCCLYDPDQKKNENAWGYIKVLR